MSKKIFDMGRSIGRQGWQGWEIVSTTIVNFAALFDWRKIVDEFLKAGTKAFREGLVNRLKGLSKKLDQMLEGASTDELKQLAEEARKEVEETVKENEAEEAADILMGNGTNLESIDLEIAVLPRRIFWEKFGDPNLLENTMRHKMRQIHTVLAPQRNRLAMGFAEHLRVEYATDVEDPVIKGRQWKGIARELSSILLGTSPLGEIHLERPVVKVGKGGMSITLDIGWEIK